MLLSNHRTLQIVLLFRVGVTVYTVNTAL